MSDNIEHFEVRNEMIDEFVNFLTDDLNRLSETFPEMTKNDLGSHCIGRLSHILGKIEMIVMLKMYLNQWNRRN